jgi:hypothetical protein
LLAVDTLEESFGRLKPNGKVGRVSAVDRTSAEIAEVGPGGTEAFIAGRVRSTADRNPISATIDFLRVTRHTALSDRG